MNRSKDPSLQSVAVVGGGITGISAALSLSAQPGVHVTLLEKRDRLGGLSDHFTWGEISWDRFYHVVLSTDRVLIDFVSDLGLDTELVFTKTQSGFFGDNRLVSLSSTADFVRFPFLSLWQKFRLATGILYSAALKDASKLDRVYTREWLTSVFGRRVYERIWDPLLRSKLGTAREGTSAAFIWATIRRLYGARDGEEKKEQMGYVRGGYRRILERARQQLHNQGVDIRCSASVHSVEEQEESRWVGYSRQGSQHRNSFDRVLLTVPSPKLVKLLNYPNGYRYFDEHESVTYLGVVCLLLILRRSLSPYYVINLLDESLPFTGVVEATNVVSPDDLAGNHLVYLPKYAVTDDPIHSIDDEAVYRHFHDGLLRIFPDLDESDILNYKVFREKFVQPLQEVGDLGRRNEHRTPLAGVYVANTAMMKNTTLNNNAAITLGRSAAEAILEDIKISNPYGEVKNHV